VNAQLETILLGCLLDFLDLVIIEYAKRQVNIGGEVIIPDILKQLISDFRDILINLTLILLGYVFPKVHSGYNVDLVLEGLLEVSDDLEQLDGVVFVEGMAGLDLEGSCPLGCESLEKLDVGFQEVMLEGLGESALDVLVQALSFQGRIWQLIGEHM
jgi:uncharacterized membrane protein YqaE (UPF0057 family)